MKIQTLIPQNKTIDFTNKNLITPKQQEHKTRICKYCDGTGRDTFNSDKPCPNCTSPNVVLIN